MSFKVAHPMEKFRSLYLHFPFCETKCHYCDFYSIARHRTREEDRDRFAKALRLELELRLPEIDPHPETVFLGGGTPSMTPPEEMQWILEPLLQHWKTLPLEWTMEANPSSVERARLQGYRALGVNRVSLGVQSLRDDHLQLLGRPHTAQEAIEAIQTAGSIGFQGISVDLLCGIPGQTVEDLESFLKSVTQLGITHLSCYLLTLPEHHALYPQLPHEEEQQRQLLFLHSWMTEQAGFRHYETSNFARSGFEAQHNLRYWARQSVLGFGPSAHSYSQAQERRWRNTPSIHGYAVPLTSERRIPIDFSETLTRDQIRLEKLLLGLRLDLGLPLQQFKEGGLRPYLDAGLLEKNPADPSRIRLSPRGMTLLDSMASRLEPAFIDS